MGVFFGFCNAQLVHTTLCQNLTERIIDFLRRISHRSRNSNIILRHAGEMHRTSISRTLKIRELLVDYCPGNFASSVRSEVGKNYAITSLDASINAFNSKGNDELIGYAFSIGGFNACGSRGRSRALPLHYGSISLSQALPALVAVHSVIATAYGGNLTHANFLHRSFQLLHIGQRALGRHIASIQKGVHINLIQAMLLCHFQKCDDVGDVAVHTAIG